MNDKQGKKWIILENRGVTAAKGFQTSGVTGGLKKGKKDIAVIYSENEAAAAGVFTCNLVQAAPVLFCKANLENPIRALVINSGNANACTGKQGKLDANEMAGITAAALNIESRQVMVSSTGVIGVPLPMDKINKGISEAVSVLGRGAEYDRAAAEAIMTTDTVIKQAAYRCSLPEGDFHIAGIAKGSGMICPNMATMLAFIATDVRIAKPLLEKAIQESAGKSYNLITVDGDTSTNDMVIILANGMAQNPKISEEGEDYKKFLEALNYVNRQMASNIIRDGEGTTKLIEVTIKGVTDYEMGRKLSMGILNSNLVKTAFFGEDANWGRIITAMGYSCQDFVPEKVDIFLGDLQVMKDGVGLIFDEEKAKEILRHKKVPVLIDLKLGTEEITAWGSDLSYQYVTINSSYRS